MRKILNYLMIQAVKNDEKNQLLAPSNTHRVRDLIKKSNDAINKQENNDPKFRRKRRR